ncbi:YchJ family protein [Candidatus Neptunichlamydia sp. REUL1]|uniref:YchJ family protein n=1 Tax=Candidatus Neptunichlamydia sp. REUL1 TaxID=3064277 RepID=UPI00292FA78F|nr:YchJ family metal-binding protein [Candidatus Neptunochlamydia sp. REUL1]
MSPPTPESLMRSRYTAYTQNNLDYIEKTMQGEALKRFDRKGGTGVEGIKLDVLFSEEEGNAGTVQFIAHFRHQGEERLLHEISSFQKVNGKWYYTKGIVS